MRAPGLSANRVRQILRAAARTRVLVVGDLMLDQFIWGTVARISPEAPVPVVDFVRENLMPGGAANVARNLTSLGAPTQLFGVTGLDATGRTLKRLLLDHKIGCAGVLGSGNRHTCVKTRIVAHQQQVVRIDRETRDGLARPALNRLLESLVPLIPGSAAVVVCDYGKGIVSQELLDRVKQSCRRNGVWLSLDPKPVHRLDLTGLSLITPNRKETFDLAGIPDETRNADPLSDLNLMAAAGKLLAELKPAVLLVTLGELGMLLCQRGRQPFHIPTVAQEVFDVSGAGDTVIGTFSLAIAGGASPIEAALLSNYAAGIVVGKIGTATVTPDEILKAFK